MADSCHESDLDHASSEEEEEDDDDDDVTGSSDASFTLSRAAPPQGSLRDVMDSCSTLPGLMSLQNEHPVEETYMDPTSPAACLAQPPEGIVVPEMPASFWDDHFDPITKERSALRETIENVLRDNFSGFESVASVHLLSRQDSRFLAM